MWLDLPGHTPDDEEVVWVRVTWYSAPFLAAWSTSDQTFTDVHGLVMPWWAAWRWRAA